MAINYKVGDVVVCKVPYRERPQEFKLRPAIIVKINHSTTADPTFCIAAITGSTHNEGRFAGRLVKCQSREGKTMRLDKDSFINLQDIRTIPAFAIARLVGACPIMDEINKICIENGITF